MIELRTGTRIWIAAGVTDMRRGFDGLSAQVQTVLEQQPFSGHVFVFRGRRGDIIKFSGSMATAFVCSPSVWRGDVHLAAGYGRNCLSDPCAAFDAARRHRLAQAAENLDARDCGVSDKCDSPVFMRVL